MLAKSELSKEVQEMRECEARYWLNKISRECLEREQRGGCDPRITQREFFKSLRQTLTRTRGASSAGQMLELMSDQYFRTPERYPLLWQDVMRNIKLAIAA